MLIRMKTLIKFELFHTLILRFVHANSIFLVLYLSKVQNLQNVNLFTKINLFNVDK
jgi:hypothetical protein